MSKVFNWKENIDINELEEVTNVLKNDGLVVLPTETVYGIAANSYSEDACKKIYLAKNRKADNPLIVHVANKEMINDVAFIQNDIEQKLIDNFMPGPFTIILKKNDKICKVASSNMDTIGVRMPDNKIIRTVIEKSNLPLAAPSANVSGRPSGTNIEDIKEELNEKIDIFVDGGQSKIGIESTVVKVENGKVIILRPGYITEDKIRSIVGDIVVLSKNLLKKVKENEKIESPGMKYRHYAPKTKCILVKYDKNQIKKVNNILKENENVCVLGFKEDFDSLDINIDKFINLGSKFDLEEISKNIFKALRKVDSLDCNFAIIEGVEEKNLGLSIMNRLIRACEHNII